MKLADSPLAHRWWPPHRQWSILSADAILIVTIALQCRRYRFFRPIHEWPGREHRRWSVDNLPPSQIAV